MSKKENAANIVSIIPDFLKTFKRHFDENAQDIIDDASGISGMLVKLFAKQLVDQYFEKVKNNKLTNLGFHIYIQSAFSQIQASLEEYNTDLKTKLKPNELKELVEENLDTALNEKEYNLMLVFQPTYHPAIVFARELIISFLDALKVETDVKNKIILHFNNNIDEQIKKHFGSDYIDHLIDVRDKWLDERIEKLLLKTVELDRIGFLENESLKYETAYGRWKSVSRFQDEEDLDDLYYEFHNSLDENEKSDNNDTELKNDQKLEFIENQLVPLETLIDEYFNSGDAEPIKRILFIVSDFGKGKSVFLKNYASNLAKKYLQTGSGRIPIYFNLREFNNVNYQAENQFGIIESFLSVEYGISLQKEEFKKHQYYFLIDSLDECGELSKKNIDHVIESVKRIQLISTEICRDNRLIITSRPVDNGLKNHLEIHEPYIIKSKDKRDIPYYLSLYGFKKEQLNDWLNHSLTNFNNQKNLTGFAAGCLKQISEKGSFDFFNYFINEEILSYEELRRPIFAYMIYQLMIKNAEFTEMGKIGVYTQKKLVRDK